MLKCWKCRIKVYIFFSFLKSCAIVSDWRVCLLRVICINDRCIKYTVTAQQYFKSLCMKTVWFVDDLSLWFAGVPDHFQIIDLLRTEHNVLLFQSFCLTDDSRILEESSRGSNNVQPKASKWLSIKEISIWKK